MSVRLAPFVSRLEGIFNIRNLSIRDCLWHAYLTVLSIMEGRRRVGGQSYLGVAM